MSDFLLTGTLQSTILMLVALGIAIPFRILRVSDLTVEGSFPLGGAVYAALALAQVNPLLATLLAGFAAGLLGIGTALIHQRLRVEVMLGGIILSTMVYSINLRLMGQPNLSLLDVPSLFFSSSSKLPVLMGVVLVLGGALWCFLQTENGLRMRAAGCNPRAASNLGINCNSYLVLGLFIGNLIAGIAGGLAVQNQAYADVGMGVGMVIHALAALLLGECLLGSQSLGRQLAAPLVGAFCYQHIQGFALYGGLIPSDLRLVTGLVVLAVLLFFRKVPTQS